MTSAGCMLLLGLLVVLPLAFAGPALGIDWTIYIAYVILPLLILFAACSSCSGSPLAIREREGHPPAREPLGLNASACAQAGFLGPAVGTPRATRGSCRGSCGGRRERLEPFGFEGVLDLVVEPVAPEPASMTVIENGPRLVRTTVSSASLSPWRTTWQETTSQFGSSA